MWMWIVGAILLVIAVCLYFARRSQSGKLAQVMATETSTCAQAAEMCRGTEGMSAVAAGAQVEVKGTAEPREVLTAEMSGRECVCYKTRVERKWEEERWERDSDGNRQRRTRSGTETMSENEILNAFDVCDETGKVLVDPQGANIDWVDSVDKFERGDPEGGTLSIGGFRLSIGGIGLGTGGRRTLGYHYQEWILPPQRRVYVLGAPGESNGEPCIVNPDQRGSRFIVSVKSEEEIVKSATRQVFWLTIAAGLCAVAGVALIVAWLTTS